HCPMPPYPASGVRCRPRPLSRHLPPDLSPRQSGPPPPHRTAGGNPPGCGSVFVFTDYGYTSGGMEVQLHLADPPVDHPRKCDLLSSCGGDLSWSFIAIVHFSLSRGMELTGLFSPKIFFSIGYGDGG